MIVKAKIVGVFNKDKASVGAFCRCKSVNKNVLLGGSDKCAIWDFSQTTILRPFFDIFKRLPKTQNFFLLKNYPPALGYLSVYFIKKLEASLLM